MILLALGSNIGAREDFLRQACAALNHEGVAVLKQSSVMETAPLLPPDAPADWDIPFLNQVLVVETRQTPEELLATAKKIEAALGRQNRGRWGPREIDIDLIAYHAERRQTEALMLPHPGISDRDFVLKPLAEVAPEWRHPVLGKTAREMLRG